MGSIRSVLWIGAADDLITQLDSRTPNIYNVWEREVRPGLCLGREAFDAVVVDTKAAPALEVVRTLSRDSNAPVLVLYPCTRTRYSTPSTEPQTTCDCRPQESSLLPSQISAPHSPEKILILVS